jgi:type IV pilus assembly protein PilA
MAKNKRAFSLLDVLLAVAAFSILAGIVILAINPYRQLATMRNAQRWVNINTILDAVYQYSVDNKGVFPTTIPAASTAICRNASPCGALVDLSALTVNGKYVVALPRDPKSATANNSYYYIKKSATTGRITVSASRTENGIGTISVTR